VLVALPTGDANILQKRKDMLILQGRSEQRAKTAFSEMNSPKP
jgi:hypothetical protein